MNKKKLSKEAYGGVHGKDYVPYITGKDNSGSSLVVMIIGCILAAVFCASTAYSGMKAGLTVAAGIPGAILGSALIGIFAKEKGILGKDLLQGMASGGESVASGMIYVLPSVILIGTKFSFLEGCLVGLGGGLVGIGVSSTVYNYLLIEEHGKLMYPEAMAISETLVASDAGGDSVKFMSKGFGIGGLITVLTGSFFNKVSNVISITNEKFYRYKFEVEANPLLLGIGFIVGKDVAIMMFAGSVLANFAVLPLVGFFSEMAAENHVVWNNAETAISVMSVNDISGSYLKYIGAGMMLCGGIIGAISLIPTIVFSIKETMKAKSTEGAESEKSKVQSLILIGSLVVGIAASMKISTSIGMVVIGLISTIILAALFAIVSGRLTGTIGTSNLPVSGMTIASVVILTLVFVANGWTNNADNKALLLFGTFIVVSIASAGGYTQSQKVAYIIGGRKSEMQKSFVLSTVVGVAVCVGTILLLSDKLAMTGANAPFALPQANLMSTLTSGIMSGSLPWIMIIVGVVMALVMFMLKLPIMTVAIGFYLPISTTSIILMGALVRMFIEKTTKDEALKEAKISNGISVSSGLVAGGSIIGLVGIILQVTGVITPGTPSGFAASNGMGGIMLAALVLLTWLSIEKTKIVKEA